MIRARDPASGAFVLPSKTGARAECPYCAGPMAAHCGEALAWHWSHLGETCQEWEVESRRSGGTGWTQSISPPKGLCFSCSHWRRRCWSEDPVAALWMAAYVRPTCGGLVRVLSTAPQCPGHRFAVPLSKKYRRKIDPSQILSLDPDPRIEYG